jgi:hypothetical protein
MPLAFIEVAPREQGFFNSQVSREAKNDTNLCSTIADKYAAQVIFEQKSPSPVCVRRPHGHSNDSQYVAPILCKQKLRSSTQQPPNE